MSFRIETVTVFVSVDKHGDEGAMGWRAPDGGWMPIVCADEARVRQMYLVAQEVSYLSGLPYRVVQFTQRVDVTDEVNKKYGQ